MASYAIHDLEQRGIVAVRREGRQRLVSLQEHRQLILHWAREYSWRDNLRVTVRAPIGSIPSFLRRLASLQLPRCALTLHAGPHRISPHAPIEEVALYVGLPSGRHAVRLAHEVGWPPDPSGGLHLMLPHYEDSVWVDMRSFDTGPPVVSALQQLILSARPALDRGSDDPRGPSCWTLVSCFG